MTEKEYCERCGKELKYSKIIWLELDQRTNTYSNQPVPYEYSQGGFAFGKDCAMVEIKKHGEAND